jgi:hypothetical protein
LLSATAFLAYLVSTPATVFEPFKFFELLRAISSTYARGHYGYSVTPGWEHFSKVLVYFAVSYFSPYRLVSALLFLGVLCGGALWVRADRKQGLLLIGFPLVFLAFFCGRYSALIVRNYLLIAPFLALLLARGVGELVSSLPRAWMRSLVFAGLAAIFASNAAWLVSAAESIRNANLERDMRQALSYVAQARGSRFRLSPRLTSYAIQHELPRGQEAGSDPADLVAFLARAEGPDEAEWPANDPWAVERVFGPREVNFHWYPSWAGADRVVVMSLDKAVRIGVPFLKR